MAENPSKTGLSRKAGIIVFSRAVMVLVQMASMMVLTRILTKEDFGLLTFLLLLYSSVITLAQLGLPESVFYFFERVPKESRKSFALLTGRTLFYFAAAASLILIAFNFIAPLWGFEMNGLAFPLILLVFLELPMVPMPNILIAIDRAKQAAWLNIAASSIQFAALTVPALLQQPVGTIVWALLGYGLFRCGLSAFLFLKNFPGKAAPLPEGMMREQLRYSVPLGIAQILWGLNRQIDKYVVAAFLPVTVYAVYVVGSWEIPIVPTIAYSVASVMMPSFVGYFLNDEKDQLLSLWFRAIEKVAIVVLPLTILFLLVAEEFIVVLFSEAYIDAALPFRIYTLILLHRVAAYSSLLKAIGETRTITYSAILLIVTNFILSIPLVMVMGIAGPPTATLLANVVSWLYVLTRIKDRLGISFREVFPFRSYARTLAVAGLSAVPVYFIASILHSSYAITLTWKAVMYLAIYAGMATLVRVVQGEDWRYLLSFFTMKSAKN
ncbi:polysaccharide biosynthesis protein [candidate division KSB1 bacterium]|nr:polysaccharide biosynthesis protein [candidate division KSB1 bacterium]NIS26920.1 polysaccharide biosynthesis protein [candidate division KSB1 bacterium]NIT73761.1 polysaccharide biosynthesis protein [candidate division KSB1 bacterium]NIX73441.1 oligosaccharide flippase family protein [candidate division KSB1 bacterium]